MEIADLIGSIAAICTTAAFLPQVIKTWKTKSTKDISLSMFLFFSLGVLLWLIFGFLINSLPVIIANALVLVMALILLGLKLKYG